MSDASTPSYLVGPEECEAFLSEFEAGAVPSAEWTHQAHIAMATVYLTRYGDSVLPHTRAALRNHLLSRGKPIGFYHETLTIFWLAVIAEATQENKGLPQHEIVQRNCAAVRWSKQTARALLQLRCLQLPGGARALDAARSPASIDSVPNRRLSPAKNFAPDILLTVCCQEPRPTLRLVVESTPQRRQS